MTRSVLLSLVLAALVPGCAHAVAATVRPAVSRRNLLRGAFYGAGLCSSSNIAAASAYTIEAVKPNETETYRLAQSSPGPLRVLWVGAGSDLMKGVSRDLFAPGNDVVALDLLRPDAADLSAATAAAAERGYKLRFEQGDATRLKFADASFDVVVCSLFLCQDFDPAVVVSQIRRVLKPGGRFGSYEHVEDIDNVIVGKVFGERSVIRIQAKPERSNTIGLVVRKVSWD